MKSSDALSSAQRKIGSQRYIWFTRVNAISFAFLADNVLILYAIKNGADDFLLGLITSFFFLTMPVMFFGRKIVGRVGAASAYTISWTLRNLSAATLIGVPFLIRHSGHRSGLILLAAGSFGFFAFRSIGLTANTPIIGEITDAKTRGRYLSRVWLNFNVFVLIATCALIIIFKWFEDVRTYQMIIAAGSMLGLLSAMIIYRVPESDHPRVSGQIPMRETIAFIWSDSKTRKLLFTWSAAAVSIVLSAPFSMVALKRGYGVNDYNAFYYVLILIIGAIISASVNKRMLDKVGPRPMLNIFSFGFIIVSILWIFSPVTLYYVYPGMIFLLVGVCRAGTMTAMAHYFLTIVSEDRRVGVNMFMYMISGTAAGIAGTFLGGGLLKFLNQQIGNGLTIYRIYFVIIFVILIPLFFVIRRTERVSDWRVRHVLGFMVSFRDIRALFALQGLERYRRVRKGKD